MSSEDLARSPLGKNTSFVTHYDPGQLCAIARTPIWPEYGFSEAPWQGVDTWNAWEISWLNAKGLPQVAIGEVQVPASSANIIESKSLKLYLNSLSQTKFEQLDSVTETISRDLSDCAGEQVTVRLFPIDSVELPVSQLNGYCLDQLDVEIDQYQRNAGLLSTHDSRVSEEILYSHLLKTNCPVTRQPDWGSVVIEYSGRAIDREGLLKYIVSFRDENDFHEHCTERIFLDIMQQCQPDELTVYTRYLRRGGLDINPWRSSTPGTPINSRLVRQ